MNNNDEQTINKFFQDFANSTLRLLSQTLDKDVFKTIEYTVASSQEIVEIKDFQENNILYKLNYVKGMQVSTLGILVPEELLASITDVIMGGSGENAYKDSLSELEINASSDLFKKITKDIELLFKAKYNQDLAFDANPQFLLKDTIEYKSSFDNPVFDFVVTHSLVINETEGYTIRLLLNSKNIKQILTNLKLTQGDDTERGMGADGIKIDQLADVKIEITAELGSARVPIKYALELVRGSIIELDTLNNSDIKVFANGVEVAMAQVVAIEENFGLKITKIISPEERMKYI